MSKIERIKSKLEKTKTRQDWFIQVHHMLLREYGWIPLEELKSLPIPTVVNLLEKIRIEREERKKKIEKAKNKKR